MAENRRVRMTKQLIKSAFIDLVVRNPKDRPTVTEVCEWADVNRSTFYAHYSDINALFEEIEQSFFEHVPTLIPEDSPDYIERNRRLIMSFFRYIADDPRLLTIMKSSNMGHDWEQKMTSILFADFRPGGLSNEPVAGYFEYVFVIMGALAAVREWDRLKAPMAIDAFGYLIFECCRKALMDSPDLSSFGYVPESRGGGLPISPSFAASRQVAACVSGV